MLVVGAGLVGLSLAWQLLLRGRSVQLIDPQLEQADPAHSGSAAALGVLMAQVFHRSSGRGWRLRQRSHQLWPLWLAALERRGRRLPRRQGLLQLASCQAELEHQQRLVAERQRRGIPLEHWGPDQLKRLQPALPAAALGGLHSPNDGQLDPGPVLQALWAEARASGLQASRDAVVQLERRGRDWQVHCRSGNRHSAAWLVVSAGLGSGMLLDRLGHPLPMEPVLGQALELELAAAPHWTWPGVCQWRGLNLVPRPDLPGRETPVAGRHPGAGQPGQPRGPGRPAPLGGRGVIPHNHPGAGLAAPGPTGAPLAGGALPARGPAGPRAGAA